MNSKPIFNTKGSGTMSKSITIIIGLILMALSIVLMFTVAPDLITKVERSGDKNSVIVMMIMPFLPFLVGLMLLGVAQSWSGTYVQVFSDHMEGKALIGTIGVITSNRRKEQFFLTFDRISHVTVESSVLKIHADGKEYKVLTNSNSANEVFRLFNSIQQSSRFSNMQLPNR